MTLFLANLVPCRVANVRRETLNPEDKDEGKATERSSTKDEEKEEREVPDKHEGAEPETHASPPKARKSNT